MDVIGTLPSDHDWLRALQMTSNGFLLYGPGSYAWYQFLDHCMPKQTVENLVLKSFIEPDHTWPHSNCAWNNLWQGKISELPNKYKKDALPTLFFGELFIVMTVIVFKVVVLFLCIELWRFNSSSNNLTPIPGNRLPGQGYRDWNRVHPMFPRPQNPPPIQERITGRPPGLTRIFQSHLFLSWNSESSMRWQESSMVGQDSTSPSPLQGSQTQQWMNMQVPTQEEEQSRLSPDEQKKAPKMLKKEIYNPKPKTTAKHLAQRLSLYYRDTSYATNNSFVEKEKVEDEEGKRCAICLDDFEPKQLVTLTPCNHMFHEECIVPWVKSYGQCPVCRFVICKPMGQNAMPLNNNYTAQIPASGLFTRDAMSILRAMNDDFYWGEFEIF
ncbi:unnamed protein product [Camellia sinensis]